MYAIRSYYENMGETLEKPPVYLGDLENLVHRRASPHELGNFPQPFVRNLFGHPLHQVFGAHIGELPVPQGPDVLFQRANRLHERALEGPADCHDLSGGLHLGAELSFRVDELVEGPARDFYHAVVQRGLESGVGLAGNRVLELVQGVAQGDS